MTKYINMSLLNIFYVVRFSTLKEITKKDHTNMVPEEEHEEEDDEEFEEEDEAEPINKFIQMFAFLPP